MTTPLPDALELRVATRDDDEFWRQLDALLVQSFEPEAYRSAEIIRPTSARDPQASPVFYPVFAGLWDGDDLLGFITVEFMPRSRVLYLWYMAVAPSRRSGGLGSRLLAWADRMAEEVASESRVPVRGIVAEVETPSWTSGPDDDDVRRLAFYARHGYGPVPVTEIAPPFGTEATEPEWYQLMLKPVGSMADLEASEFARDALTDIFLNSRLNGRNDKAAECLSASLATRGRFPMNREEATAFWDGWTAHPMPSTEVEADWCMTWGTPDAETRFMPHVGYGVFATQPIPAGVTVATFGGYLVTGAELATLGADRASRSIQVEADLFMVTRTEPEAWDLYNHSCSPTCGLAGSNQLVTLRDIAPGEELTFDYATCDSSDYDEFECLCGQPTCRGVVTGLDWTKRELQDRYAGWFSPYLQRRIASLPAAPD